MIINKSKLVAILFLLSTNISFPQNIQGRIVNQFGAGVPNAELKLYMHPNEYSTNSNLDGSFTFTGLTSVEDEEQLPKGYGVSNNFPNPFNPETRIMVTLPKTSKVKVDVYNVIGQIVLDKPAEILSAGTNQIDLKLDGLSNGIYLARITIDDKYTVMRKLSLVYGSQHLSKVGPSGSSFLPKSSSKSAQVNIDSLVVTGTNVTKTTFTNLPAYTGSNLNLGTLTANIEMELTEETFLVDSSTANKLIEHDSTTFTFASDADQLQDLEVGKILVIGVDDGYLKKVTAIEEIDDKIIVSTENASLDEVIQTGSINFQGSFDVSNALIISGSGEAITLNKAMGQISVSFGGVNFGGVGDMEINSGTSFESPEFIFDMEFDKGVKRAEVGIIIENDSFVELLTHNAVSVGGSYSPPWATIKFYPGIPTGIPFIHIVPVVKITLSANLEVGIESINRLDVNTVIETGVVYENSTFQGYASVEQTFEQTSNLTSYAEINGSLAIPRAGLYLNGFAGAFLELSAGGSFRVANDNSGIYRGIYGSIGINGGFEIDVFGYGIEYNENIYEKEWELSKEYIGGGGDTGIPCPGIPTVNYAGKTYNTVQIGDQCWLKENLNYETTNSWCYDNNTANCNTYGRLYTWLAAMNGSTTEGAQGICPDGWHIPTLAEFEELETFVGDQAAKLVREDQPATAFTPTNETGFSALFAGYRNNDHGSFGNMGFDTYFWSSSERSSFYAYGLYLYYYYSDVSLIHGIKDYGFSVRCVQD